jgi:SAM-dependent methyltransferase
MAEPDHRAMISEAIFDPQFCRATFAGPQRNAVKLPWQRVTVRPVQIRGETISQWTYFDGRKTIVQNGDARRRVEELLRAEFSGIHVTVGEEAIDIRTTKKGIVTIGRSKATDATINLNHNRIKDLPIPEGTANHLLTVLGIATDDGRVKPTMRAKYTQINEFLRHLKTTIDSVSLPDPITILDCGCGASYLTLAAHHYLNHILHRDARLIGVDVNDDRIRASLAKADHLAATGIEFQNASIHSIKAIDAKPDVVLALHACDTATDDALAMAVRANAKVILAVPCCHRAMNRQLTATGLPSVSPILKNGLLRERLADLATDAFRAQLLKVHGYRVDVVEFVAPEISPKNLMIRAVKISNAVEASVFDEYEAMKQFFGVIPELEKRLALP